MALIKCHFVDYRGEYCHFVLVVMLKNKLYFKKLLTIDYDDRTNPYQYIDSSLTCDKKELFNLEYSELYNHHSSAIRHAFININEDDIQRMFPELIGELLASNRNKSARN